MYGHLSIAVSSIIVMILWYPLTANNGGDGENRASAYILFFFTYFSTTPSTVSGFYNLLNAVYARVLHSLINELIN